MNIFFDFRGRWPQQKRIEQYCYDVLNHFFKGRCKRVLELNLVMKTQMSHLGFCEGDRNEVTIELSRKYDNELIPLNTLMKTLAHELIHAKQFFRGEINSVNDVYAKDRKDYKKVSYRLKPWEHESYMMEDFMYKLYWQNQRYIDLTYKLFHNA